jgi:predicted amidophosphoribosyltransferase
MSTPAEKEANRVRQQRYLETHREEVNEYRRDRYAERKAEGKCPRCGKKLRSAKSVLCKNCLGRAREYNAR